MLDGRVTQALALTHTTDVPISSTPGLEVDIDSIWSGFISLPVVSKPPVSIWVKRKHTNTLRTDEKDRTRSVERSEACSAVLRK